MGDGGASRGAPIPNVTPLGASKYVNVGNACQKGICEAVHCNVQRKSGQTRHLGIFKML